MLVGQYITRLTGLDQFSPPFSRGGQGALFSIDVLDVPGGSVQLLVDIEHKNTEDTSWTVLDSFAAITTTGVKTKSVASGAKEMLRFNFSVASGGSPQVYDTFYINVLAPAWMP